jgi:Uma2 family endonuclease
MSTTAALLTVDEFLALPEEPGVRRELIGAEIIAMAGAGLPHEITKSNFDRWFWKYFEHNPIGRVMVETMYRLSPHDSPQPDVSVILQGRLQPGQTGLAPFSPDIAIEVVSSESAKTLQAKVKLYLQHGTRAVWGAYPELRLVVVHDSSGVRELTGDQRLEAPEVLPGFSVPVESFFEGV